MWPNLLAERQEGGFGPFICLSLFFFGGLGGMFYLWTIIYKIFLGRGFAVICVYEA